MAFDPLTAAFDIGGKILDKFFPDPTEKAAAQLKLMTIEEKLLANIVRLQRMMMNKNI